MSILASFLSAPFLLGTPVEIYMYGTMYVAIMISYLLAAPVTAHLFVPVFHRQQLTSSYEVRIIGPRLRIYADISMLINSPYKRDICIRMSELSYY